MWGVVFWATFPQAVYFSLSRFYGFHFDPFSAGFTDETGRIRVDGQFQKKYDQLEEEEEEGPGKQRLRERESQRSPDTPYPLNPPPMIQKKVR